jgi:hypothetical protein
MKISLYAVTAFAILAMTSISANAQSVFPGKQTIDKTEYLGLILNQNVPEKYLSKYWEKYLEKYGKVKSRRSTYSIEKASLPTISSGPVQITSEVSSKKDQSQVFLALNVGGQYIANYSDDTYKNAESVLKEFSDYAAGQEELRIADETFTSAEKSYQKLLKENENTAREIEKTDKKLAELKSELEKKKAEASTSLIDLQNKQKAFELVKSKVSSPK